MKKNLGGDRLGSGAKMEVELHGYERSTHDLGYAWRSSMAPGTLVPFLKKVALPGDTFDINLDCIVKTHPTIGPLFGSYKVQLDVFLAPIRLYQGKLHNNALGIGMKMSDVKLPTITLHGRAVNVTDPGDIDNAQINPSCILNYLGMRGVGSVDQGSGIQHRDFNAIPYLAYWDTYKNYYANKQEEIGAVIHAGFVTPNGITTFLIDGTPFPEAPATGVAFIGPTSHIVIIGNLIQPDLSQIRVNIDNNWYVLSQVNGITWTYDAGTFTYDGYPTGIGSTQLWSQWDFVNPANLGQLPPKVATFPLSNIDDMRDAILVATPNSAPYNVNSLNKPPYSWIAIPNPASPDDIPYLNTQEGLAIKTYQSDLFNNWLSTDWIDGTNGITAITSVDTSSGKFSIDQLNLSKKVYDMLNRIAVSGGSYDDWIDAVYTHERFTRISTPMYMGGLIKELVFNEVVSNSASSADSLQPLGTLAGRGNMSNKHKGGAIYVKVDEPSYILGIISITPRPDYSQGNEWDTHLETMDDFHKPALDQIGFQELITEQMAYWDTTWNPVTSKWDTKSAGKQPAWINYMTSVNRTYGNFAIADNEMFMTLNRRYEYDASRNIRDLTTYIDPSKYNFIFAETRIDAQNFWVQIGVDITARRKMSAKVMPNL